MPNETCLERCPNCGDKNWGETIITQCINPNGEEVLGWGHIPVFVHTDIGYYCQSCRWIKIEVGKVISYFSTSYSYNKLLVPQEKDV